MSTFTVLPVEHICTPWEIHQLMRAGVISPYIAPREHVLDNGSTVYEYPFVGTVNDAIPA